jgi:hypothetical protein
MLPQQESALETCQQVHTILSGIRQGAAIPGAEMLAQWEIELGQAAALLEGLHESFKKGSVPPGESALRPALRDIQQTGGRLKAQFEHGSNFCMGLLQGRLGTGYSAHGLPVLMPTEARGTFEG